MTFYDIVGIAGIFGSFITSFLLFRNRNYQVQANRLLAIVIFSWGWYAMLYLFLLTGWIKDIPHIWRVGSPLYYLIPPCAYLYVRVILYDEVKFRKGDWLHFIPALIHFLELIPFYLADTQYKRDIIHTINSNFKYSYQLGEGLIPAFWHFLVRPLIGIAYLFFIWPMLIRETLFKTGMKRLAAFRRVTAWLYAFTFFLSIMYIGLVIQTISAYRNLDNDTHIVTSNKPLLLIMSLALTGLGSFLFSRPEILYGMPASTMPYEREEQEPEEKISDEISDAEDKKNSILSSRRDELVRLIEQRMTTQQAFKEKGLSIGELASQLKIPVHHLSYMMNKHYEKRFNDFVNGYRINYILERFADESWRELTLEGLASEAGFSSRSTFFATFKKMTGLSPSEFLQAKKEER